MSQTKWGMHEDLFRFARAGNAVEVTRLLQHGADVHYNDDAALRAASSVGHTEVVRVLLDAGADVSTKNHAAIRLAANQGQIAVVDLLILAGSDPRALHSRGLYWAVDSGHFDVADRLIDAGADINALFSEYISDKTRAVFLKKHARSTKGGYEAVMLLKPTARLEVLRHLHPDLKPKQIREGLAMMHVLGLDTAQMAEMWRASHSVSAEIGQGLAP